MIGGKNQAEAKRERTDWEGQARTSLNDAKRPTT